MSKTTKILSLGAVTLELAAVYFAEQVGHAHDQPNTCYTHTPYSTVYLTFAITGLLVALAYLWVNIKSKLSMTIPLGIVFLIICVILAVLSRFIATFCFRF
jgi:uncharacterized protein YacL